MKVGVLEGERVLATRRSRAYSSPDGAELRGVILGAIPREFGPYACVGVCAPGLLDESRGVVTRAVNLPGIEGLALREVAGEAEGAPPSPPEIGGEARVRLCTDAHAAAVDIWRTETPRPRGRMLVLVLGTGVGACVLDDGEALRVSGRSPGHLGQVDVRVHEPGRNIPIGPDGGRGSLEAYMGLAALMSRYGCDAEGVVGRIAEQEAPLLALARAIRIGHAIYRPDHVRLAGGIGIRLVPHLARVRELVEDGLSGVARPGHTLGCATSDFHAALGAAWLGGR